MEKIDSGPEQIFEVRFEAGVSEGGDKGVEDVGDGASDSPSFRQRSRVGFVLEGAIAMELEFIKEASGRG